MSRLAPLRLLPLLLLAACADRVPTTVPAPEVRAAALLTCHADVAARSLTCAEPAPSLPSGVSGAVLGGQGVFVRLRSNGADHDGSTFRVNVTVQNLLSQALGTADGVTPGEVRVVFGTGPDVSRGEGSVSVQNPDGTQFLLEAEQPYFSYPGLLAPGDTTPPREWRFDMPESVQGFTFQVYVVGPVRHEVGFIGVAPAMPSVAVGETMQLAGTVHGVSGRPLPEQIVSWASADSSIATVTQDGTITGAKVGWTTVTATSNGRVGRAVVHVGSGSGDGVPPTLRELTFAPARVNADGVDSVTVTARVADPGTGVASVAVSFESATAEHATTCFALAPASGTRAEGIFRCRIAIRPFSEDGVWTVRSVEIADRAGNARSADAAMLEAAHVQTSLYVRSASPDLVAPAISAVRFSPDSVAAGADSVRVEMDWADAGVGVHYAGARFTSPSGAQSTTCAAVAPDSGTVRAGTFACRVGIAAAAEQGDWRLEHVSATDSLGNTRTLSTAELQAAGYPTRLRVAGVASDVTPPSLTGFSFAPGGVAADGVDSVTVTMELADAGSGVQAASIAFASPTNASSATCHALSPVSGTRNAGTFACRLAIPGGGETGAWSVSALQLFDTAGNTATLGRAEMEAAGFPVTLTVTD